jgi:hypothetical protein
MVEGDSKAKWKGSWMLKAADGIWSGCGSSYGWIRWWGTLPWCEEAKYEIEMGLCHDARRQAMMLRWDFAMMRWSKVWCWDGTGHDDVPSTGCDDVQSYVDYSVMRSELVIMVSLRGAWASMDGRRGGWLGGLDLIVVEGSSMLKARVRWNGLRRRSRHGLRRRASTLGSCENS